MKVMKKIAIGVALLIIALSYSTTVIGLENEFEVNIHIDFIPNLFFSTYDVEMLIDGEQETSIEHGKDKDLSIDLTEGKHVFEFISADDSSVVGSTELDVSSDVYVSYQISCYNDKVNVEVEYIDREIELASNEVKVLSDKYAFTTLNYEEVVSQLSQLGFTNIITVPLYDIELGWTEEGEVENVTINGTDDYKRGFVFTNDCEVIVTYHMKADDDPTKIKVPYDTESAEGVHYQEVVKAFEKAGFTNISIEERYEAAFWGYEANTVANIYINGIGTFDLTDAYAPDANVRIDYYVISDGEKSTDELSKFYAQKAFENYGELLYPYGFECHWFLDLRNAEQLKDGSWYLKVGVTVTTKQGKEFDTVAEGIISGSDANAKVVQFHVND